jgi:NAD+ synthase
LHGAVAETLSQGKEKHAMNFKEQILDLSRQNNIGELSPFINKLFDEQLADGTFPAPEQLVTVRDKIVDFLIQYREQTGRDTVVLGMSGGVDSALTAALFKKAGWRVIGFTLPIHQNNVETDRGVEACEALGIEHFQKDLSNAYDAMLAEVAEHDTKMNDANCIDHDVKIRRGNIRARLRMITLYNMASFHGGLVASTDNFSELNAGFWTLHGDVGDLSPIQSLLKSWEVPYISMISGVPESTYRATPTDGLGISAGDEAQLGGSYLEWDIIVNAMIKYGIEELETLINDSGDVRAAAVFESVTSRMGKTWFKRINPINVSHPIFPERYDELAGLDGYFQPSVMAK